MESSESSPFDSLKSKKVLHSSMKSSPSDQVPKAPDQSPWSSKTPEKPSNPPRRGRNHRTALSVKEVKQFAEKLRKWGSDPSNRPESCSSATAKRQVASWPTNIPVAKSEKADGSMKLPEKIEILDKFFNSLHSSIRLLGLKGSMSTFTNISPKVECLTDRRFSHGHLAQLKFILPEAIEIEKVLILDERTSCMKPDLHVTLNINAIQNDKKLKSDNGNLQLRKVFHARLLDFFRAHPEVDEVPEETLPEPFNQSDQDLSTKSIKASSLSLTGGASTYALLEQQPAAASHLSQFFRRHFSKQVSRHEAINTTPEPSMVSFQTSFRPVSEPLFDQGSSKKKACISTALSPVNFSSKSTSSENCLALGASLPSPSPSHPPATPSKKIDSTKNGDFSSSGSASIQGTPAKLTSTPAKLMSATPALQPPKRCYMSPVDDSTRSPNKLVRHTHRSRSLKFDTPVKNVKAEDEVSESGRQSVDDDNFEILPDNLLQSIREKERKALEEKDPAISLAKQRRQMIANLPKLFDMLHFLFQSIKCSIITKEELMQRIIASRLDIVDRREVEEQLRLLQQLVPEWIYEKSASSGDLLLCINKMSSPESIRARLAEAN